MCKPRLPEWVILARGFVAYYVHGALDWACFAILPWAGDWAYRDDRREASRDDA